MDAEFEFQSSLEAIVLLQRSMLEKQWELPFEDDVSSTEDEEEQLRHIKSSCMPPLNKIRYTSNMIPSTISQYL